MKEFINKIKNNKTILAIIIAVLLITITGTFAWLSWKSKETALVLKVGDINGTIVTLKPYQLEGTLSPVQSYTDGLYTDVNITNNSTSNVYNVKLYYNISAIDDALKSEDFKYTILNTATNETTEGNFLNATTTDKFIIFDKDITPKDISNYKIYIWISGEGDTTSLQGKSFKAELRADIVFYEQELITISDLVSRANPSTLAYADATDSQKAEMWTFSQPETSQLAATTDYRYIGANPNNYITYNGETWRIIGVFDGKAKIIRDTAINLMAWDYKKSGVGSSASNYGSNDWTDSQLMYMLNPTSYTLKSGYTSSENYIKDANGNIIYQLGCKTASIASGADSYSCEEVAWTLNTKALSQIDQVTYYLGGNASTSGQSAIAWYNAERGTTVYSSRSTSWNGYVGLMYPSDYAYTFANGVDDTCYNDTSNCSNGTPSSSWLFLLRSGEYLWTLSHSSNASNNALLINITGNVNNDYVINSRGIFPVVYLKSNTKLLGYGTKDSPYKIYDSTENITMDLPEGLIPITYDTTGSNTIIKTISKDDSSWYDYRNQKWANAVLVKENGTKTRNYYKSNAGTTVAAADILAYYVYIPRYRYQIWETGTSTAGKEQTIEIEFENNTISKKAGTKVGEYLTHPAFTFGNTELNGIWVSKFELSGTVSSPTIIPDTQSIANQSVSNLFTASQKFGTSSYGNTSSEDAHMIKNSEWGAVAYLTHSAFGKNSDVFINNSTGYYTGRSGGNVSGKTAINTVYTDQSSTHLTTNYGYYTWDGYLLTYNTNTKSTTRDLSKVASTTGNITGIYDMSGGVYDYVMGVHANSSGNVYTGYDSTANSGYNGLISSGTSYTGGTAFPDDKYYDKYISINVLTACNGNTCFGHSLSETTRWYSGYVSFNKTYPWVVRGGYSSFSGNYGQSGLFNYGHASGVADAAYGTHSVLVKIS